MGRAPVKRGGERQRLQNGLTVARARLQAGPAGKRECESAAADGFGIDNRPDIDQQRAFDADEAEGREFPRQALDGVAADVRGGAAADRHVVAVRLDVVDFVWLQRVEPVFALTDEKRWDQR